jgi:hypothetical protein
LQSEGYCQGFGSQGVRAQGLGIKV